MHKHFFMIVSFLACSFGFGTELSLTVVSYVGKLEYSAMDFGPWKALEVDDRIPQKGYLRLSSAYDNAELLRNDGVTIRLVGNTLVTVESLLKAPKPRSNLAGLFRKKKPVIEIENDVAVAAVRGSIQGHSPSSTRISQPKSLGISVGVGGVLASETRGFLLAGGYTNKNWYITCEIPFLWKQERFLVSQWSSIDGFLTLIQTFQIGSEEKLFFLRWGEGTIRLGEGLLVEQSIRRFHPYFYNENILQAQINFGDVGVRALLDRPSDMDKWAVEAFIRPFWGVGPLPEQFTIRAFIINEQDSLSPFFSSHFSPTSAIPSYVSGYGISLFAPLFEMHKWQFSLLGEIGGINERPAYMGGSEIRYDEFFSLKGRIVWSEAGFVPWYFHTFYRYTRPQEKLSLTTHTNASLCWSLSGKFGEPSLILLSWDIKRQLTKKWLGEVGVSTGTKLLPWAKLFVGWVTDVDDITPVFTPEHNLSLLRLVFYPYQFFVSFEYAHAQSSWEKGVFSFVGGYTF